MLEKKLKKLREDWKQCNGVSRTLIEQRARLLEWAIEKRDKTYNDAKETLL